MCYGGYLFYFEVVLFYIFLCSFDFVLFYIGYVRSFRFCCYFEMVMRSFRFWRYFVKYSLVNMVWVIVVFKLVNLISKGLNLGWL